MTALYIIVGILLFIFLLLMIPVSFRFRYDGEPELILQYLFVRIKLVPPKEKSEKQKNESEKSEKPKEKKPEENNLKKLYKKRGLDGLFEILSDVISIIKDTSSKLIKHIVIKKLKIDLLIVGEDAGDTAMKYGYICSALYPVVSFIDSNMKLKKKQIDIEPGFTEKETKIFAETKVSIRPWFALGTIISAALRGIKLILGIKKDIEV